MTNQDQSFLDQGIKISATPDPEPAHPQVELVDEAYFAYTYLHKEVLDQEIYGWKGHKSQIPFFGQSAPRPEHSLILDRVIKETALGKGASA